MNKYSSNQNDLRYFHMFGIFLTLIGIIMIIPKLTHYYKKYISEKKDNQKYVDKNKLENLLFLVGIIFFIYGIKEVFFRSMTDHEILTAQLLFYLRENNVISADIYQKLHTFKQFL